MCHTLVFSASVYAFVSAFASYLVFTDAFVSSHVFVPDTLLAVKLPISSIVAQLFCIIFHVVESNLAIALSVEEAGHVTSHDHPLQFDAAVILHCASTVISAVV